MNTNFKNENTKNHITLSVGCILPFYGFNALFEARTIFCNDAFLAANSSISNLVERRS